MRRKITSNEKFKLKKNERHLFLFDKLVILCNLFAVDLSLVSLFAYVELTYKARNQLEVASSLDSS